MKNLKPIMIDGELYQYEVVATRFDHFTEFYKGTCMKKMLDWSSIRWVKVEVPKKVFTVHYDIEYSGYTKEFVKSKIDNEIRRMKRENEIERGEII